jgi:hypothetical protein
MYIGSNCEYQTEAKKSVQRAISAASIIAIVVIILLYVYIVAMDLSKICIKKKPDISTYKVRKTEKITKLAYIP